METQARPADGSGVPVFMHKCSAIQIKPSLHNVQVDGRGIQRGSAELPLNKGLVGSVRESWAGHLSEMVFIVKKDTDPPSG